MKKRGFTLVELLAIILILAIIALITVPMIITLIRNARKSVFKSNAEQVLSASKMYYSKNITDDGVIIEIRENQVNKLQYMNDTTNSEALPGFQVKGKLPQKGKITITDDGKIAFDLYNGDFCAYKTEDANTIYILEGDNCDKNVKIPKIEGTVTTKDKDKLVVVASGFYEEDNVRTPAKIVRYGFKIDNGDWKYTTNDYYIFNGLKSGSTHNIKISCTNEVGITVEKDLGNKIVSNLDTTVISAPTGWAKSKTVTITYPKGRYKYQYSLDEGVTWLSDGITNGVKTLPYSSQDDNGKYVMARVLDKAGNVEEAKVLKIAGIDTTLPTCGTISGAGTTSSWTKNNRTVSVGCSDNGECSNTSFSNTFSSNATTGIIQISDKAGNKRDCTVGVYIDKSKPTCGTISGAGDTNHWTKDNRTVSVACSDTGGSTCSQTSFSNTFSSNATTSTIQISDKAGNTENCTVGVYIDKTAPTCSTSGGRATWSNAGLTLTGTCSDQGGSGCSNITKSITGSNVEVAKIDYEAHVQDLGWTGAVSNGNVAGLTGHNKRLEAIAISISAPGYSTCGVRYQPHIANYGWDSGWTTTGNIAGTTGQSISLEAIKIELTGDCASKFNIQYRTHVQDIGWMDWVSNGAVAGTTGQSKNLEAIQIFLEPKSDSGYQRVDFTPVRKISPGTVSDGAGNTASCPAVAAAVDDGAGPVLQKITNTSGGGLVCGEVGTLLTAVDSKSGVQKYQISSNNSTWTDINTLQNTPHTAKQNNTIYLRACDNAGNCSGSQSTVVHIGEFSGSSSTSCSVTNCGGSHSCKKKRTISKSVSFTWRDTNACSGCGSAYCRWLTGSGSACLSIDGYCQSRYGGTVSSCNYSAKTCLCNYSVQEEYWTTCYDNASCEVCNTTEQGATCHD